MYISKSNYVTACQCVKALWLKKYRRELAEVDAVTQARFDVGTNVGEFAQALFPGGIKVEFDGDSMVMAEKTMALIDQGQAVIYEAAFTFDGLIAICDILVKTDNAYSVYEVKSATNISEPYLKDTAFQYYVLTGAGLNVAEMFIVFMNNQYIRQGPIDLHQLFKMQNVTENVISRQADVHLSLPHLWDILLQKDEPAIDIGPYCSDPYTCAFMNYCWRHIPAASVFNLYKLQGKTKFDHYYNGIITFDDLQKKQAHLSTIQMMQVESELTGQTTINHEGIHRFLKSLSFPLCFLDFETFQQAIPQADGIRPYEQVPFQYSLHFIEQEGQPLQHKEFIGQEGTNPKRALAERLVADIPTDACILAYHASFERSVIVKLAEMYSDLEPQLCTIADQILDLEVPFKSGYYYVKAMNGSFSIKSILPALFPDDLSLDYHSLDIQNGEMANQVYATLHLQAPEEIQRLRQNLLAYCKLDTLAMVRIWEKLRDALREVSI